jgi:hypothetical protein
MPSSLIPRSSDQRNLDGFGQKGVHSQRGDEAQALARLLERLGVASISSKSIQVQGVVQQRPSFRSLMIPASFSAPGETKGATAAFPAAR